MVRALWIFLLLCVCFGEVYEGTVVRKNSGFWFLGRFAFENSANDFCGSINIHLTCILKDLPELQGMEILLYDDAPNSWPAVYQQSLTCTQWRMAAINWNPDIGNIDMEYHVKWEAGFQESNTSWQTKAYLTQIFRPRFWYVALSSCDANGTGTVNFNVHFLNILANSWNQEFGVNEMGLNTVFVIFFVYYFIFLAVQCLGVFLFWKHQKYVHPLIRLFTFVVAIQFCFILSKMIHYIVFSSNGKGVPDLDYFGDVLELVAKVCFILMLMLLALGWTISTGVLHAKPFVTLAVVVFSVIWIAILVWRLAVQDPAQVELPFELRVMQLILLIIWFLYALWFLVTCLYNWKKEDNPVKKRLFAQLGLLYGLWFVGLPIAVAVSYAQEPWVREKIVIIVSLCISTLAHGVLAFLLWPSRAEEYFSVEKPNLTNPTLQHYENL